MTCKLCYIVYALMRDGKPFDPDRWCGALPLCCIQKHSVFGYQGPLAAPAAMPQASVERSVQKAQFGLDLI